MRIIAACLVLGIILASACVSQPAVEEQEPRSVARRSHTAPATPRPLFDVTPVELDGRTDTYACIVLPVTSGCQFLQRGTALQPFAMSDEKPIRLQGNLTWIAETPATASLNAYLVVDGRYQYGFPVAYGPSPVVVDFDLGPYAGRDLAIGFSSTSCVCPVAMGIVHAAPQDFQFRGEFTSANV